MPPAPPKKKVAAKKPVPAKGRKFVPPPPSAGLKIQYTDDPQIFSGVKCVVYGPAGGGKTRLLATAPSPIILSAEKGLLSLKKFL